MPSTSTYDTKSQDLIHEGSANQGSHAKYWVAKTFNASGYRAAQSNNFPPLSSPRFLFVFGTYDCL